MFVRSAVYRVVKGPVRCWTAARAWPRRMESPPRYRTPLRESAQLNSPSVGSTSTSPPTYTVGWLA